MGLVHEHAITVDNNISLSQFLFDTYNFLHPVQIELIIEREHLVAPSYSGGVRLQCGYVTRVGLIVC